MKIIDKMLKCPVCKQPIEATCLIVTTADYSYTEEEGSNLPLRKLKSLEQEQWNFFCSVRKEHPVCLRPHEEQALINWTKMHDTK